VVFAKLREIYPPVPTGRLMMRNGLKLI
jgi:hypothetical protein